MIRSGAADGQSAPVRYPDPVTADYLKAAFSPQIIETLRTCEWVSVLQSQARLLKATGSLVGLHNGKEGNGESNDESKVESKESSHDRSEKYNKCGATGKTDLLTRLDLIADSCFKCSIPSRYIGCTVAGLFRGATPRSGF